MIISYQALIKELTQIKKKHLLVENELKLYLIFQPIKKTIKTFSGLSDITSEWEPKGLSDEKTMALYISGKSLSPKLVW